MPNIPNVTFGASAGIIKAFEFDSLTNKLYIAGEFDSVGTIARKGFAVIDVTTGAVLNDFSTISINDYNSVPISATMKIFNHKLYVGGLFTADSASIGIGPFFAIDLTNGSITPALYGWSHGISDFKIYNNKIYTTGSVNQLPKDYMVSELDTLGNTLWQKSISTNFSDHLNCLDIRNNNLFVGGEFSSFDGKTLYNI